MSDAGSLPLTLRVAGRLVVVVGGGHVATRRATSLRAAGADVRIVSPTLSADLAAAVARGDMTWVDRSYRSGDLDGAWLVQTATADPAIDDLVAADAEASHTWCLKGGDPERSTAWTPAVARVDDVTVAVSGGGDARRATALRDAVATALHGGDLPLRHRTHRPEGFVALVGGGPGDPDLLTLRARRLLADADVVVVDRLAPTGVLTQLPAEIEVIDVGKRPGHHPVPQHEINAILVARAREGKVVVRLKGGDPYVFGRGGEELAACREAGVRVEVVPGVTSAIAVASAAGIPVTHRGVARGFTVVSGHETPQALPLGRDHTIILLMGVARLRTTAAQMIEQGRDPGSPVAVVEDGCSPRQRVTVATLATVADLAEAAGVLSPAVIVIGDVVTLCDAWTRLPCP